MLRRAALLAIPALLATATPAEAYRFAGKRWPGAAIPYSIEAPLYGSAVAHAARAWNRARVGVRFTRVPSDRARLVIRYGSSQGAGLTGCEGENGRAILGWPGAGYPVSTISLSGACRSERLRRLIAMHELGHALGLDHDDRRCALMNTMIRVRHGIPGHCRGRAVTRRLRKRPLSDDIRGARALYRRPPPAVSPTVAWFRPDGSSPLPRRPVTFSAGWRNPRLTYEWDFGDPWSGPWNYARGLDSPHVFSAPGRYEVTLTVMDGDAEIASRTRTVAVLDEP